jgi:hypothetical protein
MDICPWQHSIYPEKVEMLSGKIGFVACLGFL